jgi:hypothetical protein
MPTRPASPPASQLLYEAEHFRAAIVAPSGNAVNLSGALIAKFFERHAPQLAEELEAENAKRRGELRDLIAKNHGPDRKVVTDLEVQLIQSEARVEDIRKQLEHAQNEANSIAFSLSDVRSANCAARDKLWDEARALPCDTLVAFRAECEARLADSLIWARTWPSKRRDPQTGEFVREGNRRSLDAYTAGLIATRDAIDRAIRVALDGQAADQAIADMRAAWPRVQIGVDEFVVPTAPRLPS